MSFNLLHERWLPLVRRSGRREWVSVAALTDELAVDPFVRPDWGRADFDAATLEFLIGLLATAFTPQDDFDWQALWCAPPSAAQLAQAFVPLEAAFKLYGDGPRFMQELGGVAGDASPVSGLFIEAPGGNTVTKNTDLFQKRGQLSALSLPAAAMALFTLQAFAPSGGAGHRTSLRGGGPLTTLVLPKDDTLWAKLWLNVPSGMPPLPEAGGGASVFPWLGPPRSSEKGAPALGFEDMHPLSAFWWVPRRITLDMPVACDAGVCAVSGEATEVAIATYRTRPWGMNATGPFHPLSPMYRTKPNDPEWLFVHPQPGGLGYNHWVDIVFAGTPDATRRPASIVPEIITARAQASGAYRRLWVAGYDMDNMKARGFVEASFPLFLPEDPAALPALERHARELVEGARETLSALRGAVSKALALEKTDASRIAALTRQFYDATEAAFFDGVRQLAEAFSQDIEDDATGLRVAGDFLEKALRPSALRLFDEAAPLIVLCGREKDMGRVVEARRHLVSALFGRDRKAVIFAALKLPFPEKLPSKRLSANPEVMS